VQRFPVREDAKYSFSRGRNIFIQAIMQKIPSGILEAGFAPHMDAESARVKDAEIARDS
jgi:hypothetical protein